MNQTVRAVNDAGVAIYPVDARGLVVGQWVVGGTTKGEPA